MTISVVMLVTCCNCKTQNICGTLYFVCCESKILDLPQKHFFLLSECIAVLLLRVGN